MASPRKYQTDQERMQAIKNSQKKYSDKKLWLFEFCNKNFTMWNKIGHCKTKKHNLNKADALIQSIEIF